MSQETPSRSARAEGAAATGVAFALWGLLPVYWKALKDQAGALEIIAHRIVWSLAFTAILVRARGLWGPTLRARRERTVAEL